MCLILMVPPLVRVVSGVKPEAPLLACFLGVVRPVAPLLACFLGVVRPVAPLLVENGCMSGETV